MEKDAPWLYSILRARQSGIGSILIQEATHLDTAARVMREQNLKKISESRSDKYRLVTWWVE